MDEDRVELLGGDRLGGPGGEVEAWPQRPSAEGRRIRTGQADEWITELGAVLASYVPLPGSFDDDGPGPFSLAASSRITDLLHTVGYTQISVDPVDEPMRFGDNVNDVLDFVSQMGLVSSLLDKADEATRADMLVALHERLASHETAAGVFLRSAAWLVTARRPG